jgi:hypothetical protein
MSAHREENVPVARSTVDAVAELLAGGHDHDERIRAAAERKGRREATRSYSAGYAIGHDTGLSARQDTRRFVHGILDGWQAGCRERHQLVEDVLDRKRIQHLARRQAEREAEAG